MGMDLSTVVDSRSREAESLDSPGKIILAFLSRAKGKTLTESRFIDLDNINAGSL